MKSHTLLVTSDGKEATYCPDHLAITVQNLGAMRAGETFYASLKPCEVCEWHERADRHDKEAK